MLRRMYFVSLDYVGGSKQSPPPPAPTTQPSTPPQQESRTKRIKKKKTTKHGRRRVTEKPHPYDKWVKMRSEMQESDIDRKTLIQKIADFLQKFLPNSNAHAEQAMTAPPESPDARADFKSEAPASPSGTPSCHANIKAYSHTLLNVHCPRTRTMRGLPVMSRVNRRRGYSAHDILAP